MALRTTTTFASIAIILMHAGIVHGLAFQGSLPLITHPVHNKQQPTDQFKTILDPPNELLANGKEVAMIIPVDSELENVLLQIPSELNWNYHFGCFADEDPREKLSHALLCAEGQLVLKEAGLMFFTFQEQSPMRVKVYTSNVPFDPHAGEYYAFDEVPFDEMWADDRVWMPSLLANPDSYFEAHFVFDGPPGTSTPLLSHSYKVL